MRRGGALLAVVLVASACTSGEPPASAPSTPASPSPRTTASSPDLSPTPTRAPVEPVFEEFDVPAGARPHDVAPAPDGRVWYTAQGQGALGVLDPSNGDVRQIPLGSGSRPHGVIVGPDGAPWVTDGGLNAIVRVDPSSLDVRRFPLSAPYANLNTAAFDGDGVLWFTGQEGIFGRVDPRTGDVEVFDAPRGRGPYGMHVTPAGRVWFSSLAGSYIARVGGDDGRVRRVDIPTPGGGARRVWSDSVGDLWVTEWFAGKLARYEPDADRWTEWDMPASGSQPYAVFVDERDIVWVSDFGSNALVRFDPSSERFRSFRFPSAGADVRQLLGRPGEVWGAGSGTDTLVVLRTG